MPNHERAAAQAINQSWPVMERYFDTPAWRSSGTDPAAIMRGMPWASWTEQAGRVVAPLAAATAAAFGAEAPVIGAVTGKLGFNVVDDVSIKYAQTQGSKLIAAITEAQRATVRTMVAESLNGDWTVDQLGRKLRSTVGLHPAWATAVSRYEDKQVNRLILEGKTPEVAAETAAKRAEKKRKHLLKVRGDNIARTEIQTASNLGKYATWDSAVGKGFASKNSRKEFSPGPDACKICEPISGEVVAWDEPFSNSKMMPPFHPGCRCTANLLPPDYNDDTLDPDAFDWVDPSDVTDRPTFQPTLANRIGNLTNRPAPYVAPPVVAAPPAAPPEQVATPQEVATFLEENAVAGTPEEVHAANLYFEMATANYNRPLRTGDIHPDVQEHIDQLAGFIDKQPAFGQHVKLYRGIERQNFQGDFDSMVGQTFSDPAFLSTTLDRDIAAGFAGQRDGDILMEIVATPRQKGLSVNLGIMEDMSDVPAKYRPKRDALKGEAEILFPPNTQLRIVEVTEEVVNGKTRKLVRAEIIDETTPLAAPKVTQHTFHAPLTSPPIKDAHPLPPATAADDLTLDSTGHLSDDQLVEMLTAKGDDPEAIDKILDIMDQREATAHDWTKWKQADEIAADTFDEEAHRNSFGGYDDAFFVDNSSKTNPSKKPSRGLTKDQEVEEQYYAYNLAQRARALEDINGNFFSAAGKKAFREGKVTEELLFEGQVARAKKYASEELIQWWETNGRQSKGSFRYNALQRPSDRWYRDVVHSAGFQGRMGAARDRSTF